MYDARSLFLSQKLRHTFSGYAVSQLKRLQRHYLRVRSLDSPLPPRPARQEAEALLMSLNRQSLGG